MDRKIMLKTGIIVSLILAGIFISGFAAADTAPATQKNSIATDNLPKTETEANSPNKSQVQSLPATATQTSTSETITRILPNLERALVIATIVNLLVIIFGLAIYLVKRRMQQFSPVILAQSRTE